MKKLICLILSLLMVVSVAACNSQNVSPESSKSETETEEITENSEAETTEITDQQFELKDGGLKVGFCASDSTNPVFIKGEENLKELCEADGNTLITKYYESDAAKFIDICENFITADCDIIIVQDPDEQISDDVLRRAKEQGILVCTLDTDNKHATYVQEDQNVEASHILAKDVIDYIQNELGGKADIISLDCPQSQVLRVRCETALADILEACPDCNVVLTTDVWNVSGGCVAIGENALQAAPEAKIIFAMCDIVALGVNEAYKAAGKTASDGYAIYGYDALDDTINEMVENPDCMIRSTISLCYPEIIADLYESATETLRTGIVGERYLSGKMQTVNLDNAQDFYKVR